MFTKLSIVMLIVFFFTIATSQSKPPGEDLSDPTLVKEYMFLPCDALDYSYGYMMEDLKLLSETYEKCVGRVEEKSDDPYFGLQCIYIHQYWEMRSVHTESVKKAYELMCYENGENAPQYEINF